jgi:site-specific recombinase XerD
VAGRGFCGLRNRAIILLLLDTGMRLRELSALRLWDLDFDRGIVRVMGKGAKERVVGMGKATQKAMLRYLLSRSDPHPEVWVSEERRPLTYNSLNDAIRTMGKRAGIEFRSSAHTYRHTFATSALKNGADLFRVQALLGHSSLEMVRRYAASLGSEHAVEGHRSFGPVDKLKL